MPRTLAQKLIARAAGRKGVEPDEIVTCRVGLVMMHDLQGPRRAGPMLRKLGAPIWNPDRVVVAGDHRAAAIDLDSAGILVEGMEGLDVGDRLGVKLVHTDVERGFVDFARVSTT